MHLQSAARAGRGARRLVDRHAVDGARAVGERSRQLGITLAKIPRGTRGADLEGNMPDEAHWQAHNYEHLMEQPTIFYAIGSRSR